MNENHQFEVTMESWTELKGECLLDITFCFLDKWMIVLLYVFWVYKQAIYQLLCLFIQLTFGKCLSIWEQLSAVSCPEQLILTSHGGTPL